jgi:hypothetical protein
VLPTPPVIEEKPPANSAEPSRRGGWRRQRGGVDGQSRNTDALIVRHQDVVNPAPSSGLSTLVADILANQARE